jgi:dipeptidyl aminopeptidase/acylaminoacyl peptidase
MYRTTCTPTLESTRFTIIQEKVSVLPPGTPSTHMANFSHIPGSDIVCTTDGLIYHVDVMSREKFFSARAIWSLDPSDGSEIEPHHFYLGESEDAFHVISLGSQGQLAVEVATGLESRIDVLDHSGRLFTLFETHNEGIYNDGMYEEKGWDARLLPNGRYTLVAFRSSAITGEQTELWSGTTETRRAVSLTAKLSSHNEWVNNFTLANSEEFLWKASDGFELQGIMAYPAGMPLTKLPTVLVAHGGPQKYVSLLPCRSVGNLTFRQS